MSSAMTPTEYVQVIGRIYKLGKLDVPIPPVELGGYKAWVGSDRDNRVAANMNRMYAGKNPIAIAGVTA